MKLVKSAFAPSETDTVASYQIADFDGYADKTLTRSVSPTTWNTPVSQTPSGSPPWSAESAVAHSDYGSAPQVFTCTGATGNTIYGYCIVGATSGKLICAEAFATPRTLSNGDSLSLTPGVDLA